MRKKTLAVAVGALVALAAPASASATHHRIGIGRRAAGAEALFAKYKKVSTEGQLRLHGQRRQRRRQGRAAGPQPVRRPGAPAAPERRGHDLHQAVPRRALHRRQPERTRSATSRSRSSPTSTRRVTTNWSQVPGSGLTTTIDPVGRDTNGGTYNFFLQAVLNNEPPASNVNALTSDGLVVNAVKHDDPNAIGYVGLAWQGTGRQDAEGQRRFRARRSRSRSSSTRCRGTSSSSCRRTARTRTVQQVRRLGRGRSPAAGQDHREGRRRPGVQQGVQVAKKKYDGGMDDWRVPPRLEEEYLRPRSRLRGGPTGAPSSCSARWSLPSSACCVAMIVFVFVRGWPSFAHNGLAWFGAGGNVDDQLQAIFLSGRPAPQLRLHVPRLAADLEHDPDHRRRRRSSRFVSLAVRRRLHRRVRARVDAQHPAAGRPPAGQRALGDLRPARRARRSCRSSATT